MLNYSRGARSEDKALGLWQCDVAGLSWGGVAEVGVISILKFEILLIQISPINLDV